VGGKKNPDNRKGAQPAVKRADTRVAVSVDIPAVPDSIAAQDGGEELWNSLWVFGQSAYHPVGDYHVMKRFVEMTLRRDELAEYLATHGYTDIGSQGQSVQRVEARLLTEVERALVNLEDRLGLNPRYRVELLGVAAETVAKSKFDQWKDGA
jgi:P27 family predicted phage terminase small subunit